MKAKKINIDLDEHRIDVVIKAKKYWPIKKNNMEKLAKHIGDNWFGPKTTVMLTEEGDGEYHLIIVLKKVDDVPFALDAVAHIESLEQLFSGYLYAI